MTQSRAASGQPLHGCQVANGDRGFGQALSEKTQGLFLIESAGAKDFMIKRGVGWFER